jgi:hypothetical protein
VNEIDQADPLYSTVFITRVLPFDQFDKVGVLLVLGNGLYGLISLYWCHATYSSDPVPPLR